MTKYIEEIEAIEWTGDNRLELEGFAGKRVNFGCSCIPKIFTPCSVLYVGAGYMVVKNKLGELMVRPPYEFNTLYGK